LPDAPAVREVLRRRSFIVRNHSFREAPWAQFHKVVDDLMAGYDIPEIDNVRKAA